MKHKYKVGDKLIASNECARTITQVETLTPNGYILDGNTMPDSIDWVESTYHLYNDNLYITPKGIKYRVGTKFKYLEGTWQIVQDYQQVDPSTVKFDFTNTKIRINNPEESEWVQKVAFNNGWKWLSGTQNKTKWVDSNNLVFSTLPYIAKNQFPLNFDNDYKKEITIQDILNSSQMNNPFNIEVGDYLGSTKVEQVKKSGIDFDKETDPFSRFFKWEDVNQKVNKTSGWTLKKDNQMKEVIEVGDKYEGLFDGADSAGYTVRSITGNRVNFEHGYDLVDKFTDNYKLVSKGNKQEIIGYELLKDLPGIPAGYKLNVIQGKVQIFANKKEDKIAFDFLPQHLQDITWFKPIYKAKEVIISISDEVDGTKRIVKVEGERLLLNDGIEFCSVDQFKNIGNLILKDITVLTGRKSYLFEILRFKIGCQEFTKEDVVAINNVIKDRGIKGGVVQSLID